MMASRVAPPAPTTTYRSVLSSQRPKMPSWYVNTVAMLSNRANVLPKPRPNVLVKSACVFVALIKR